jgi:antitoxin component YwqK of YwqJK toxin-antitoxin module
MGNCLIGIFNDKKKHSFVNNNIVNDNIVNDNIIKHTLYFNDKSDKHVIINITYTIRNGLLDGEYLLFNKEGKLILKSFYKNGKLCGTKTDYNVFIYQNNEMVKVNKYEQFYENGVEISTNIIL